jgi:hypothetical protein
MSFLIIYYWSWCILYILSIWCVRQLHAYYVTKPHILYIVDYFMHDTCGYNQCYILCMMLFICHAFEKGYHAIDERIPSVCHTSMLLVHDADCTYYQSMMYATYGMQPIIVVQSLHKACCIMLSIHDTCTTCSWSVMHGHNAGIRYWVGFGTTDVISHNM